MRQDPREVARQIFTAIEEAAKDRNAGPHREYPPFLYPTRQVDMPGMINLEVDYPTRGNDTMKSRTILRIDVMTELGMIRFYPGAITKAEEHPLSAYQTIMRRARDIILAS